MTLHLTKHHGLGNDFLVALESTNPGLRADPARSRALCDRHTGVGADGVLHGMAGSAGADVEMVLHNSDGSAAEISGNGIRCLAQAWLRASGMTDGAGLVGEVVVIDTPAGRRTLEVRSVTGPDEMVLSVDMGQVRPGPELPAGWAIPGLRVATRSVGNPHLVALSSGAEVDLRQVGADWENLVPGGINVHVMKVTGNDRIELSHWERGAGLTLACGSGATVAAAVAHDWGLVGTDVRVDLPGGSGQVHLGATAVLIGPTVSVAEVSVS